jgi:hypothetical protein
MICFDEGNVILVLIVLVFLAITVYIPVAFESQKKNSIVTTEPGPKANIKEYPEIPLKVPQNDTINVGFLFDSVSRYPLFETQKNRDYLYYITDDSRAGVKIPIERRIKRDKIYDGDTISVPELNSEFTAKIYEVSELDYRNFFS